MPNSAATIEKLARELALWQALEIAREAKSLEEVIAALEAKIKN